MTQATTTTADEQIPLTCLCNPGQFKPIKDANPTIGAVGTLEQVEEHRVEVLVQDEGKHEEIRGAVEELKKVCAHSLL